MRKAPFLRISTGVLLLIVSRAVSLGDDTTPYFDYTGRTLSANGQTGYWEREAGETALKSGDYKTAGEYFEKYKLKAKLANDKESFEKALNSALHAAISANLADLAQKQLDEAIRECAWKKDIYNLYQAQIYLLQRRYDDAARLVSDLKVDSSSPEFLQKRFCEAAIAENTGSRKAAMEIYEEITKQAGRKSVLGGRAAEHEMLLLVENGMMEAARTEQKLLFEARSDGKNTSVRNNDANRIFMFYCDLVSGAEAIPSDLWDTIRKAPHEDEFFCLAAAHIGRWLDSKKRYKEAADAYYLACLCAPVRADAGQIESNILAVYEHVGNPELAAEYAEYMLTLFKLQDMVPQNALKLAKVLLAGGKKDRGFDICAELFKPLEGDALQAMYADALNMMVGIKSYAEAIRLVESFGDHIPGKDVNLNAQDIAQILELEGKDADALAKYDDILKRTDGDGAVGRDAMHRAFLISQKRNDLEGIVRYGKMLRGKIPDEIDVLNIVAIAEEKMLRYGDASAHFREYAKAIPADNPKRDTLIPYAYYRAGYNAARNGDNSNAVTDLQIMTDRYPAAAEYNDAMLLLIQSLFRQDNATEALLKALTFSRGHDSSAQSREALLWAARQLFSAGDFTHTEDCLKPLRGMDDAPDFQAEAYYLTVRIALMDRYSDNVAKLVAEMSRIVQKGSPYEPTLHFLQGELYRRTGAFEKARTEYKAAQGDGKNTLQLIARGAIGDSYFEEAGQLKDQPGASPSDVPDTLESKKTATYRKALAEYKALAEDSDAPREIVAMALYKTAKTTDFIGKSDETHDTLRKLLPLCDAAVADVYPQIAIWVARGAFLAEEVSLKAPDYENTHFAEKALQWLGACGKLSQSAMDERLQKIRNLLQYQTPPQTQNTRPAASAQNKKGDEL